MRPSTLDERRRVYLLTRVTVARHYRHSLTLDRVARALASSPRQVTRAYAQFGQTTFREDLLMRRMRIARESRGFEASGLRHWGVLAKSAGALFIRSYERGERVHRCG